MDSGGEQENELSTDETFKPGTPYAWYSVVVLLVLYTFSFIDRTIIALMIGPIRESLQISDTQVSLLHGLAFALFYTLFGIPIAKLSDSRSRQRIITFGALIWSGVTAMCGLAGSFWHLFMMRMGVGVGEAALSPAAYSMIADYFDPPKLTRAMSLYSSGVFIGSGLAYIVGGAVIDFMPPLTLPYFGAFEPWQSTFIYIGLPGLLLVLWFQTVKEPPRRQTHGKIGNSADVSLNATLRFIREHASVYGYHFSGFAILAMIWAATAAWIPTMFVRKFGWAISEIGLYYGLINIVFGIAGIWAGSLCANWLRERGYMDADVRTGLVTAAGILPFGILAPLASNPWVALALLCPLMFFISFPWGAAPAALQMVTPNRMRAQVSAVFLFSINLLGIGTGPTLVALFTDGIFKSDDAVDYSLAITVGLSAPLAYILLHLACKAYRHRFERLAEDA